MNLVFEIEYLSGVSFAAIGPDSDVPDWPPQPDRVFSALVATWAARGQRRQEADALEWLEQLPAPRIVASSAEPRTGAAVFVPPNDARSDKQKHAREVVPALRNRQPRQHGFPAVRPHTPVVHLSWNGVDIDEGTRMALERLAHDTSYVGHSASLTRCRFLIADAPLGHDDGRLPARRVYAGRLAELRRAFDSGRRPLSGSRVAPAVEVALPPTTVFGDRWLLLEHIDGEMPDLQACALVAKTLRDALLSGYRRIGLEREIPEVISGHVADGNPARTPHLAIIPLPFAGFPYADGHVLGFALVPPRDSGILDDHTFRKALRELAPIDEDSARRCLTLRTKEGTPRDRAFSIVLSPTTEASRRSLEPAQYTAPACTFATATPIALDRHLKEEDGDRREAEISAQIAVACRNIGLPAPVTIVADKHSALEGVPSAYPSGNSPDWTRWRLPPSVMHRQLTHAVIRFGAPVAGPVILGAGRFVGLGLCRPLDEDRQ
ncbi:MAG: type I-U CRISPR-associated protein Cas5/Cas6 [Acidobacteria bacterium]|nr:type I-U CRISPR-associated protein Cas5/Cas6 [Acidobacteriota bacterium]